MTMSTGEDAIPKQPSRRRIQDQRRAADAWEKVAALPADQKARGEYRTAVLGLPAMLLANGLGQTLAFVNSKRSDAYRRLYQDLGEWLGAELGQSGELMSWVVDSDLATYRLTQREALRYVEWLKRFVEAAIPAPADRKGGR